MQRSGSIAREVLRIAAPLVILAVAIGGFLVFGKKPQVAQRTGQSNLAPLVDTAPVERFADPFAMEVEGVAVPFREVTLAAEVAGRVREKADDCQAGNFVQQGKFLLAIDPTDYDLEVERLQAQLQQADEEMAAVDVNLGNTTALITLAKRELELRQAEVVRRERLANSRAVSDTELDEVRRLRLSAQNALQQLENQQATFLQQKKTLAAGRRLVAVALRRAEVDRQRTQVLAPLTGTVSADLVNVNEYVKKGDPLVRINDTGRMEVRCSLTVDELYWVWLQGRAGQDATVSELEARYEIPSTPVEVVFEFDGVEYVWDGRLSRFEGSGIDEATRTVPARVVVDQPTQVRVASGVAPPENVKPPALLSGMYVTIRIQVTSPVELLRLPTVAVRPGDRAWLARDGQLEIVPVDVAQTLDAMVLVRLTTPGLAAGDRVVTSPLAAVRHGMPIKEHHEQ